MATGRSCTSKNCNSTTFEEESSQTICVECGTVVEEGIHFYDPEDGNFVHALSFAGANLPEQYRNRTGEKGKSVSEGKKVGNKIIEIMCQKLILSKALMEDARNLYERAISKENFGYCIRLDSKQALALACVYIICRQNHKQIAMTHLCKMSGVTRKLFSQFFLKLKAQLGISIPGIDIEDFYNSLHLSREVTEKVRCNVMDLFHLCQNCWLTTGHNHEIILHYLTFIAWVAECYGKRRKTTWGRFTKQFKVQNSKPNDRQKSILKYLVEMASNIPWIDVNDFKHEKDALAYLDDILKYRVSLVNEIVSEMAKVRDNINENVDNVIVEVDNFKDDTGDSNRDKFPQVDDDIKNEKQINTNMTPDTEQKSEIGSYVTHKNNEKKNLRKIQRKIKREPRDWTVPKIAKSQKRIQDESRDILIDHPDLDCEDLTEHDIPDDDVGKYVKSEHEVKRLKLWNAQSEFDD